MKKLLILLLAAGMILLAGCASGGDTMEGENTFTQIEQETAKEKKSPGGPVPKC